ncbi:SDR family oxidoreductase [Devosia sp.]|jgi:nucleoside-diphosphate-sugar epimerase|uniref:SDR family oxidoreductase n=1 Tax=Devosia sp. TaxID=1871048 RepID=UPI003F712C80
MRLFFFGMGYSSRATARALHLLADPQIPVAGTTRSAEAAESEADSAYRIHVFDGEVPGTTLSEDLRAATHVILSIPPDERGDAALNLHRADLDAAPNLEWIGYFSTVGVYGDFGGEWIDEEAPTRPLNVRSKQRVEAEQAWRDYARQRGVPLFIVRLAGIYGPGRSAFDKLREGTARRIVKPNQVFNRIHVADIGRITARAALSDLEGTYNLADTEPAPPQDLVTYAAHVMGIEPPAEVPFETAEMTPMARSFYSDNKRVSSKKVLAALGADLLYPTYREGLDAIWKGRQ